MSGLEWREHALGVDLGRLATATLGGEALYLVRHADLATFRVEGDAAVPWHEPVSAHTRRQLDDRNLQVALDPDGVLYALLGDGTLWRRERGGELDGLSAPDLRIAGHYAHRTGFVYDSLGRRLVIVGGDYRNDGYTFDLVSRTLTTLPHGPGHGVGQTLSSEHGVFRLVRDELWLLEGEQWTLVAQHDHARTDRGLLLFSDPRRDAVFFVSQARDDRVPPTLVHIEPAGPKDPVTLSGSFSGPLEAHEAVAQVDPATGRLWMIDRLGARYLDLASFDLDGGSPVVPIANERRVVHSPPQHWYREAISLRQRDEEAPELPVPVRDGWALCATLPVSPLLPLGDAGSVVVLCRELPYDYDPWTLGFMNAFEVRIVDEELPLTAGGMLVEERRYLEIEPIMAEQVDTSFDGAPHLARGSKIGGFPALVQGTKEEAANAFVSELRCEDCDTRLRFVAQLTWPEFDLISAVLYVYACPFGHCGAARAMNV